MRKVEKREVQILLLGDKTISIENTRQSVGKTKHLKNSVTQ